MKKIVLAIIVASMLILSGCESLQSIYQETKSTDLKNESLIGMQLFTDYNEKELVTKYGKPDVQVMDQTKDKPKSVGFDPHKFGLIVDKSNKIVEISGSEDPAKIGSSPLKTIQTSRGIMVGDTFAKVKRMYGKNYYERKQEGLLIIGYVDHKNHIAIEFWGGGNDKDPLWMIRLTDSRRE